MAGGAGGGGVAAGSFAEAFGAAKANNFTILTACVIMIGAAMFGADQQNYGLTNGLKSFNDQFCPGFKFDVSCETIYNPPYDDWKPPKEWSEFITLGADFIPLGMALGALVISPPLARYFGRKPTMCIGGCVTMAGCAIAAFVSNRTIYLIGRLVTGFGCGVACYVLPMYMAEVSPQNIRGTLGSLFQFMIVMGQLVVTFSFGVLKDYKIGFLMPGMFGVVIAILIWFFPESPNYLIEHKGKEAGRAALQSVRANDCSAELDAIEENMKREREIGMVSWIELFTKPGLRKRLFVACWLQIAQQLTGVNAFLFYQSDIFGKAGISKEGITKLPFGAAMNLMYLFVIGIVVGLALIDSKYGGRRFQLISASVLMGGCLVFASIVQFAKLAAANTITCGCVFLFGFGFQYAWGIIPWFYPAELFFPSERERALAVSTFGNFAMNYVILDITQKINHSWGSAPMYMFFGALNVLNIFFVLFFVKETKGVPLDEIPALFGPVDKPDKLIAGENA